MITLKDLQIAWKLFNDLPMPVAVPGGRCSHPQTFKDREDAWKAYVKVRDQYLFGLGLISSIEMKMRTAEQSATMN